MEGFTRHVQVRRYILAAIAAWPGLRLGSPPSQAHLLRRV